MGRNSTKKNKQVPIKSLPKIEIQSNQKYINIYQLFHAVKILMMTESVRHMLITNVKSPSIKLPYYINMAEIPVDNGMPSGYCEAGIIDVKKICYLKFVIPKPFLRVLDFSGYRTDNGREFRIIDLTQHKLETREHPGYEGIFVGGNIPEDIVEVNISLDMFGKMISKKPCLQTCEFIPKIPIDISMVIYLSSDIRLYTQKFKHIANIMCYNEGTFNGVHHWINGRLLAKISDDPAVLEVYDKNKEVKNGK